MLKHWWQIVLWGLQAIDDFTYTFIFIRLQKFACNKFAFDFFTLLLTPSAFAI